MSTADPKTGMAEVPGSHKPRMLRPSIEPTYDSRDTGNPYTVEVRLNGRVIHHRDLADPFVHTTTRISWRDRLLSLLRRKPMVVEVLVGGHLWVMEDVMELDSSALVRGRTRQIEFRDELSSMIRDFAGEGRTDDH